MFLARKRIALSRVEGREEGYQEGLQEGRAAAAVQISTMQKRIRALQERIRELEAHNRNRNHRSN